MTIEMTRPALAALLTLDRSVSVDRPRMYVEHLPKHPRKASAGTRRHHRKYLPWRISQLVPGAATVLITPVWTDTSGDMELVFIAHVRDRAGQSMKLPAGGSQRLAALLQGAFVADWSRCQTWRADRNALREYAPPSPDYIDTEAAGYVESLDQYDARLTKAGA